MADTQVKGVSVSAATVKTLKAEINTLKESIGNLAIEMEALNKIENKTAKQEERLLTITSEYAKNTQQLNDAQLQLSRATEVTKGAVIGVTGSYAQLVAETNKLRKEWRSVEMGSDRFKELSEQINENNKRLKEMDKSIGDNFRNVGNYSEGFSTALQNLGGQFPGVQKGIMGVNSGMKMLSANPVIGTITLLVALIKQVVGVMKQSEEGTKALTAVMGVFDGVMAFVTKGLEFLGEGIAWVVEKVTDLTSKWFGQNKVLQDNIDIQNKQIELDRLHRDNIVKSAQVENEISELRAKSADKINYSAKERIALLEQAMNKELELMRMQQDEAQKAYELIVLKNEQTKSGTRDLEAEAEAQAKVIRMQTAYNNKMKEYNAQLTEAKRAMGIKAKSSFDAPTQTTAPTLNSSLIDLPSFEEDIAEAEKDVENILRDANEAIRKGLQEQTAERIRYAELQGEETYHIQQQSLMEEMALLQEGLDNAIFVGDERVKAEERVAQIERDIAYNTAKYEKEQSKKAADAKIADQQRYIRVAQAGVGLISNVLGSIADMYEQDAEKNAESAKKAKNLRIATATIDMLGGITTALAGAFTTKSGPWDLVLAGIQAATILASGIANIAKIKNTDVSGNTSGGGGVGAVVSPPAVIQQVPVTRTLTGVQEEQRLNEAQRVYVVYDDIAQAGRKVDVTENEATF